MGAHINNVQISFTGPDDDEASDFWTTGAGGQLSAIYGELLGMEPIFIGYHKLVHADGHTPEIGFEYAPADAPPRWPDPAHPPQVHLDIEVGDLDEAARLVTAGGATALGDFGDHRVFADPASHPFCLYPGGAPGAPLGRIARVVFDCFSPRSLAVFYEELFDMRTRTVDTPERVEIAGGGQPLTLAFQHSPAQAPRWPDPTYPAQLHLDITVDGRDGLDLIERLGAMNRSLPARPDNLVYADPAGHPFCLELNGPGVHGPAQVAQYEGWLAEHRTDS